MKTLLAALLLTLPLLADKKPISDDTIYDQVRRMLANDPDVKGGALEVEVRDGLVTVKGRVDREPARLKVDKLVKKVKGVQGVSNQVKVSQ